MSTTGAPLKLTISDMRAFMADLDDCLKQSTDAKVAPDAVKQTTTKDGAGLLYPGVAHVAMPRADLEKIGAIRRFFDTIAPHENEVRGAVAAAIKKEMAKS